MRLIAIFDTNVYRSIGDTAFEELRAAERNHSALGYANYATVTELLAHFGDPSSKDYNSAVAASARLIEHCAHYDGSARIVRFIAPPIGQIAQRLFGVRPRAEPDADGYAELLGRWVTEPDAREHLAESVLEIAAHADVTRKAYVESLWTNVVCTLAPNAKSWQDVSVNTHHRRQLLTDIRQGVGLPYLAIQIATEAAAALAPQRVEIDPSAVVPAVMKHFRLLVEYRNLIIEQLITNGPNMNRRDRANGSFDIVVCGAMAGEARIQGAPAILVTDDQDIIAAANRAQLREEVLTPEEYRVLLSRDREEFADHVEWLLSRQRERAGA